MMPGRNQGQRQQKRRPPSQKGSSNPSQEAIARRIEELKRMGLCTGDAKLVAYGKADLNTILERMAIEDKARKLQEQYGFVRALAVQIAKGHADLGRILARRRLETYLKENGNRTVFDDAYTGGWSVCLAIHGRRTIQVHIVGVDRFEVDICDDETGDVSRLHKLQVKYAYRPEYRKNVRKTLSFDKERSKREVAPIYRPQDRYHVSDLRLFTLMESGQRLQVTTLEGDVLVGRVMWLSTWEFGLELKAGGEVYILRHAVADMVEQ